MSRKKVAIGIDLGTAKCCVGVVGDGKVGILKNERGSKTTPSYVAFTETERLVGEDARDQTTHNPANTVYGVKNIIGRNLKDLPVEEIEKLPYSIKNIAGETCINVTCIGSKEAFLPQQVTAMLLTKMKDLAQTRLGYDVEEVVISVPASFTNAQRQATKDAAAIAGLKVLALINEPTAAAIAYQNSRREDEEENIAVVDFGGGKLDVAIVNVSSSRVAVRGLSGTMDLGGNDVDQILMEFVLSKFREKFSHDPPDGAAASELLRVACVKLKHALSLLPEVQYQLHCFGDEFHLDISLSRVEYTSMISEKISSCLVTLLSHALKLSHLDKGNISRVLLVGGSTRIPLVPEEIQGFFGSDKLESSVNPDEAVAQGTAIYAALLSGDDTVAQLAVEDMLSYTFSFAPEESHERQSIFCKELTIPSTKEFTFNGEDLSKRFELHEEREDESESQQLVGSLCLSDEFSQAVRLVTCVVFKISRCGILEVIAHLGPAQDQHYAFHNVVRNYGGRLSCDRIQKAREREHQLQRQEQKGEMKPVGASPSRSRDQDPNSDIRKPVPDLVPQSNSDVVETIVKDNSSDSPSESPEQSEGRAAVEELRSYSSDVATFLTNADITEVPEMADKIKKQLQQLDEWLRSGRSHSKKECDLKRAALDNVLRALEQVLELKRPEKERKASLKELRQYCDDLQLLVSTKPTYQADLQLVDEIVDEAKDILHWLSCNESVSKAECTKIRASLEDKFQILQRKADVRKRGKDAELEKKRFDVANVLWNQCHGFRSKVRLSNIDTYDAPLAKHIFAEIDTIIHWLTRIGKLATVVECDKRTELIVNYEEMFANWVKEHEQKVLFQKKENERADIRKKEEKERSDAFHKVEMQRAGASEKQNKESDDASKKVEKERLDALLKKEKQHASALVREDKQRTDAFEKEEKDRASAVRKQDKARVEAAKKQTKERSDAVKKEEKERAYAEKKCEKARVAATKKHDKERAEASKYAK